MLEAIELNLLHGEVHRSLLTGRTEDAIHVAGSIVVPIKLRTPRNRIEDVPSLAEWTVVDVLVDKVFRVQMRVIRHGLLRPGNPCSYYL